MQTGACAISSIGNGDQRLPQPHEVFHPKAKWYTFSGKLLGAGRMLASDIRNSLAAAREEDPGRVYVIVVWMTDDNSDTPPKVDQLFSIPAFIFGEKESYFVTDPEVRRGMKSTFEEGGHEFKVLTYAEARSIFLG